MRDRFSVVKLAESWIGLNERDGSHKKIIDIYNSYSGKLPRGMKMQYNWAWCAATWSAIAIKLGYTDIMPIEISCGQLVEQAKKMGCWKESDAYIPKPGDAILYDWDDSGKGENTGWPDHVGIVQYVNESSGYITTIEGNYDDCVKKRTISINGRYIRGFITPAYDETENAYLDTENGAKDLKTVAREVISGKWGNGDDRKKALQLAGYDPKAVQDKVNEILNGTAVVSPNPEQTFDQPVEKKVQSTCYAKEFNIGLVGSYKTTADLYCRNDAGTNKKALCLIPKGTTVVCYGYGTRVNGAWWLLITFVVDGVEYIGFSSRVYLEPVKPLEK